MPTQDLKHVRIEHDDDQLAVVDKLNYALKSEGLVFEDDGLPHDGFCLLTLKRLEGGANS